TPSSRSAVINGANLTGIDFSAQAQTWTISGTLGTLGSGASVALSGSTAASVVADGAGGYSFSGLPNGSYTVTPAKSGVIFTPAARSLTIASASQTGVNFSSELQPTWSISGTAGVPGSGAVVTLTGAANRTAQADLNGNYQFAGLPNGSYSVAISKPGFSFTPASQNVAVNSANLTGVNFSAQANLYNISGTLGSNGQGATVTVSGTVNRVVFADISGAYVVAGVPPGSYTITPTRVSKLTYIFAPLNQTVTVTASHVTGVNFTGTIQTFSSNSFRSREQGGELRLANTASGYLDAACSPGSMASLVGSQLTAGSEEGNGRVLVNGNKVPVLRWTGSRVDFQCPELPPGAELAIVAETADGEPLSEKIETRMQESAPGLFTLGATTWALAQRSLTGEVIGPEGKNGQTEMARAGDFLTLFATGLGAATEPVDAGQEAPLDRLIELRGRVRVVLGGTAIEPVFAGLAPGTIGLYQINFVVPAEAPRGPDVALHVEVWGVAGGPAGVSNTVRLPIARDDE
ncbi:MAG: carboxypeptidase regulatory-like domain-containing protein, partial [Bryobacteraceae bacterium]|nr:carboxypeptidase regulatory-like domain-containing protein [Bryobacteraceae bacterium]